MVKLQRQNNFETMAHEEMGESSSSNLFNRGGGIVHGGAAGNGGKNIRNGDGGAGNGGERTGNGGSGTDLPSGFSAHQVDEILYVPPSDHPGMQLLQLN